MYYKIGVLAKYFGITTQALRFYEQQGFLVPIRDIDSTTRYYHARNLKWLYSIRRYHELGFCTQEIQELFSCHEIEPLENCVDKKYSEIELEIEKLKLRQLALKQQKNDFLKVKNDLFKCFIEPSPRLMFLINQESQTIDLSSKVNKILQAWMTELGFVYSSSIVNLSGILNDEIKQTRKSGFCVEYSPAQKLGLPMQEPVEEHFYPKAIRTITRMQDDRVLFSHAKKFANEHNLELTGDAIGRCLCKLGEDNCKNEAVIPSEIFYEYWISIK